MSAMPSTSLAGSFAGISPFVIAHYILQSHAHKKAQGANFPPMTPLKLIKMVYIAHGYHLAMTGAPLVDSAIEVWRYGPVLPEIYYGVKDFKRQEVPADLFKEYTRLEEQDNALPEESKWHIASTVNMYGPYDALLLSTATHKKGTPWSITRKKSGMEAVIPNALIQEYYRGLYGTAGG